MKKILFVCMGNICRSPTAEAIFKKIVCEKGLSKYIEVDSAGTNVASIGRFPDQRSIKEAITRGVDMKDHKSRQIITKDFFIFDFIIGMDLENMKFMQRICPLSNLHKLSLLMRYSKNFYIDEVPDPYYDNLNGFSNVFNYIEDACLGLLEFIINNNFSEYIR